MGSSRPPGAHRVFFIYSTPTTTSTTTRTQHKTTTVKLDGNIFINVDRMKEGGMESVVSGIVYFVVASGLQCRCLNVFNVFVGYSAVYMSEENSLYVDTGRSPPPCY